MISSSTLTSTPFREIWTIDHQQQEIWHHFLESANLTHDYVMKTLAEYEILLRFGKSDAPEKLDPPFIPIHSPQSLFSNDQITIEYPGDPITPHHLWISLKRKVTDFTTVKPEEALMLHRAIRLVIETLRRAGISDALIAQWNHPQLGHPKDRYVVEVIPPHPNSSQFVDFRERVGLLTYFHYRGQLPHRGTLPTQDEKSRALSFWKESLRKLDFPAIPKNVQPEHPQDWTQTIKYQDLGHRYLLNHLLQILSKEVNISSKVVDSSPLENNDLVAPKKGCAFCVDGVIKRQVVAETALSYVLYNYKPANRHGHFLIATRRHVESIENLSEAEMKDIHQLAIPLIQILGKRFPGNLISVFLQNGPSVGRTVPHFHWQILVLPPLLQYLLFCLRYNYSEPLKPEEVRSDADAIAKEFKHLVLT